MNMLLIRVAVVGILSIWFYIRMTSHYNFFKKNVRVGHVVKFPDGLDQGAGKIISIEAGIVTLQAYDGIKKCRLDEINPISGVNYSGDNN